MTWFKIEPIWRGRTVVVIASGPSLTLDQVRRIGIARQEDRARVIAIKDQIYTAWWADWLHGCDPMWWQVHIQSVQNFGGIKTTLAETLPDAWGVGVVHNTGKDGFDPDPTCCRTGGNSGYQAAHMAMHAIEENGRIVTVGLDMKKASDGRRHSFKTHDYQRETHYEVTMLPSFETILPALQERRIEWVNCSPGSAVTCFPNVPLETVL